MLNRSRLISIIVLFFFISCKKDAPVIDASSQWKVNDTAYTSAVNSWNNTVFYSADNSLNKMYVFFYLKPVTGIYSISGSGFLDSSSCIIATYISYNSVIAKSYASVGRLTDSVKVSVAGNKLSISFIDILMSSDKGDSTTISGTLNAD